ncbi:copper amine oxidase N-terminal domain-containing protein [Natranaerofaba carboxydovora]|uniref:copper amine oxidase N-terminal domain-containing protein n=1 Tax=Natranaerofaba carboxydovora TaxID=2742683 RepID=UPI001F1477AE|nr:copper amine oxidase N-terminal domain-containing protein [Natranaerofaba carboxydovora]
MTIYTDVGISKDITLNFEDDEDTEIVVSIGSQVAYVDGDDMMIDAAPVIREEDNRTYLPFRIIGELLGVDVEWDSDKRAVEAEYEGTEVMLFIDEITAYIDDEPHELDSEPYIDEDSDRTMIPFRFFAEAFGADVEWDEDEEEITVEM